MSNLKVPYKKYAIFWHNHKSEDYHRAKEKTVDSVSNVVFLWSDSRSKKAQVAEKVNSEFGKLQEETAFK